jgi:hypothetical protein
MTPPRRESDVEDYLELRVAQAGGETRKVQWVGRKSAPDRLVLLPDRPMFFVEVKHPNGGILFPKNAHEEAQHREHERLRAYGVTVYVIWKYEHVEGLLL